MILLGITGGIAAYKCPDLVRLLRQARHEVQVVMTASAEQFVTPLTLQTLSERPVRQALFDLTEEQKIGHIALAQEATLVLVAPATAHCLAKVAHGLCDDLLSTIICATKAPVLFAPAMNTNMWENAITQGNVRRLQDAGYTIIPPESGELACGTIGPGRMAEPEALATIVAQRLQR